MSYQKTIIEKLEKYKTMIYFLSPSYALYDSLKFKGADKDRRKDINSNLSNLIKVLNFLWAISLFAIFGAFDFKRRINMNSYKIYIDDLLFGIMFVVIPIVLCEILLKFYYRYYNMLEVYIKNSSKYKYYFLKEVKYIYRCMLVVGVCLLITSKRNVVLDFIIFFLLIVYYGVSRIIHFFVVFVPDIVGKIENGKSRDGQGIVRLVSLVIFSYLNLIIDYTILFYSLKWFGQMFMQGINMFGNDIYSIVDMLYYTIGCESLLANNYLVKIYVILLNVSIALIITGNLSVYLSTERKRSN